MKIPEDKRVTGQLLGAHITQLELSVNILTQALARRQAQLDALCQQVLRLGQLVDWNTGEVIDGTSPASSKLN